MGEPLLKLSPSSVTDFKSCPQLFKFRKVDNLPEPVSGPAARGSLIHAVLERLFMEEPGRRTPERAEELLDALWRQVREDPEFRPTGMGVPEETAWLEESRTLLRNYFKLEDPRKLEASELEWWIEYDLSDVQLRGIIDRLEKRADGSWVLTDYKTGRVPGESRELAAFFGLRFYALVCWRSFGVIPREIRLVYLADPVVLSLNPNERMLLAFERQMRALSKAVQRAVEMNDWRSRPSPYCMSCSFQSHCPAWASVNAQQPEGEIAKGETATGDQT
ncbi:MAG: putative RecB family exonuclease [Actinomycetota bacterium]|jgi:putative RecB family exonuclease|nr:putative RecB family exonuclease [Actinomycetota bacterium]